MNGYDSAVRTADDFFVNGWLNRSKAEDFGMYPKQRNETTELNWYCQGTVRALYKH